MKKNLFKMLLSLGLMFGLLGTSVFANSTYDRSQEIRNTGPILLGGNEISFGIESPEIQGNFTSKEVKSLYGELPSKYNFEKAKFIEVSIENNGTPIEIKDGDVKLSVDLRRGMDPDSVILFENKSGEFTKLDSKNITSSYKMVESLNDINGVFVFNALELSGDETIGGNTTNQGGDTSSNNTNGDVVDNTSNGELGNNVDSNNSNDGKGGEDSSVKNFQDREMGANTYLLVLLLGIIFSIMFYGLSKGSLFSKG